MASADLLKFVDLARHHLVSHLLLGAPETALDLWVACATSSELAALVRMRKGAAMLFGQRWLQFVSGASLQLRHRTSSLAKNMLDWVVPSILGEVRPYQVEPCLPAMAPILDPAF
mmetsp:Transcript_68467/g.135301  ORF Transcript_68467/g.135301 Transcript_68467/m.135301 type:complete len:115 (-) Transcript_68467:60-404(-)